MSFQHVLRLYGDESGAGYLKLRWPRQIWCHCLEKQAQAVEAAGARLVRQAESLSCRHVGALRLEGASLAEAPNEPSVF